MKQDFPVHQINFSILYKIIRVPITSAVREKVFAQCFHRYKFTKSITWQCERQFPGILRHFVQTSLRVLNSWNLIAFVMKIVLKF